MKLADFGLSSRMTGPKSLSRLCGSPLYVAPEVISRECYDQAADMWSAGVIIYVLLCGHVPFTGQTITEIFQKILAGNYEFPVATWGAVSLEAKDLVQNLLTSEPAERFTATQALKSPWMKVNHKALSNRDLGKASATLKTFNSRMKFKSSVFAIEGMQCFTCDFKSHFNGNINGPLLIFIFPLAPIHFSCR